MVALPPEEKGGRALRKYTLFLLAGVALLCFAVAAWACSGGRLSSKAKASATPTFTVVLTSTGTPTASRTPMATRINSPTHTSTLASTPTLTKTATQAILASVTPTATKTPTSTSTAVARKVLVTWGGPYTNCHPDLQRWSEATAVRIPRDTVLEVVGEGQAPVEWEDSREVFQVKRPDGKGMCFIRKQLVKEVK